MAGIINPGFLNVEIYFLVTRRNIMELTIDDIIMQLEYYFDIPLESYREEIENTAYKYTRMEFRRYLLDMTAKVLEIRDKLNQMFPTASDQELDSIRNQIQQYLEQDGVNLNPNEIIKLFYKLKMLRWETLPANNVIRLAYGV